MNLLPVLERELRSQARQGATFWSRLLAAGLLLVVFGLGTGLGQRAAGASLGRDLFLALNGVAYYIIWLGVPLLVADSISREKREGTLGLLFLTPLSATDLVAGKGMILGLRGLNLLVAGLPLLGLPLMLGGVSWGNALFMLGAHLLSLFTALAAGLTGSALCRRLARAVMLAVLLSVMLAFLFNLALVICLGGLEDGILFGPVALEGAMDGISRTPGRAGGLRAVGAAIGFLVIPVGLLWRVVAQVNGFWREEPATTDRVRTAAAAWLRLLMGLGAGTVLLLLAMVWQQNPGAIGLLSLGVLNALMWLVLCGSAIAAAFRCELEGGRAEPSRGIRLVPGAWVRFLILAQVVCLLAAVAVGALGVGVGGGILLNQAGAALLAFGVGRLACAWGRGWMRGVLRTLPVAVPVLGLWLSVQGLAIGHVTLISGQVPSLSFVWRHGWHVMMLGGGVWGTGAAVVFGSDALARLAPIAVFLDALVVFLGCALGAVGLCRVAGRLRRRPRKPGAEEDPVESLTLDVSQPLFARGFLARRRRRVLEQNPMRWLLDRSRTSRLRRVGWLGLVALAEVGMVSEVRTLTVWDAWALQGVFVFLLSIGLAFAAALSFLEEKRTGALELILVTPLRVRQVIAGRWRGLLGQFLPALGLIAFVGGLAPVWGSMGTVGDAHAVLLVGFGGLVGFFSVPAVGMLCSVRVANLAAAGLLSLLVPLGNAALVALWCLIATNQLARPVDDRALVLGGAVLVLVANLVAGGLALGALTRTLQRREVSLRG